MGALPMKAAAESGATPLRPGRSTLAPRSTSSFTISSRPVSAALNSAVEPSRLRASIGAP